MHAFFTSPIGRVSNVQNRSISRDALMDTVRKLSLGHMTRQGDIV